ncbi:restriction endonuclease subunit S [Taylorella equigenitalis]|uniref:Type I restriction-modification system, specificity subunit S n=1 Tax=Taylorella equigenitalis (strain MCE9) TaxID=937774 RepID=A0A654KH83_TAYEM|nr:restriction endonuclease subunit S [Taylorella equigenitalis]ADU91759.1 Type I restriction-modification system, specificity subunit S [Taylorella equigenitalis MCE9]WDU56541.1 restriction endonuclease subunit S [Taylorella equigenitalis]
MKCKRYALSELAEIKYGKNQKKVLSEDGNIPIYGTGGLFGYATTALYDKPSVLIGRKGTIRKVKYVEHPFWTVDTLFYTIINTDIVIPKYLYYVMSLIDFNNYDEGTTIPSLRTETLNRLEFDIPSKEEQEIVLSCLNPIDEKVELNNAINNNLEQQIKTICTAWLSACAPSSDVILEGWSKISLSSIADFVGGYSYKRTELTESNIAMATIKNFDRKGGFKLDGYKEIVPSNKLKDSQYAELFDTLVAHTDLTQNAEIIGNAELVMNTNGYSDIVFSMDLVKVVPNKKHVSKFLIAAILQDKKFKAHCLGYVNGTTVLHLSKKALPEYQLYLPADLSVLKPLDELVTALYQRISANIEETTKLETLRDTLLPKLMSGEIDVSEIDL